MGAYVIVSCLKYNFTVTATEATVVDLTDMLIDAADFPTGRKGRLRVVWKNSGNNTNNIDLYDRFGAAAVDGSAADESMSTNVWTVKETGAFTLPGGIKSFQARLWVSAGTMTVDKIELQVESG